MLALAFRKVGALAAVRIQALLNTPKNLRPNSPHLLLSRSTFSKFRDITAIRLCHVKPRKVIPIKKIILDRVTVIL